MLLQHVLEVSARMAGGIDCYRFMDAIQVLLGTRLLMRFVETCSISVDNKKRVSPVQMQLPSAFDLRLNQIPEE